MRVPFATTALSWALLAIGITGHAQSTSPVSSAQPSARDHYEVRIEGGDLALSGLHVLKTLAEAKVLPVKEVELGKGTHTNVCDVFIEETKLPGGCTKQLIDFASTMNRFEAAPTRLTEGTKVYFPAAEFERYDYEKQYNLSAAADRVALQDDKRKAGQYMSEGSTKSRSGRFIEHTFEGYRLKFSLPSGKASEELLMRLNAYPGVFVVKDPSAQAEPKPPGYSMSAATEQIPMFCTGDGTPEEAYSQKYIGVTSLLSQRDCAKEPAGTCPEIVILDQPIAKNPEIDGVEGASGALPVAKESLCTDPQILGRAKYHSTHMAGIIASRQNGKAFIGLHPSGKLLQGWANDGEIASQVRSRRNRDSLQVYLFARSWKLDENWANGDRLLKPANRTEHIIGKKIHDLRESLWVVAAGQPDPEGLPLPSEIDDRLNLGPMNSGDQENVLVVGGCTDCGSGKARFWNQSHFSRKFVHIAAPADLIVSTATGGSYTWAQGTSQAAAFVAGVVSALVSEWPNSYKFASRVKERLQYTATPFLDAGDRDKVAAGVINPALALADPNKNYIDTTDLGKGLEEISIDGWCDASLTVLKPDGTHVEDPFVLTRRTHRIVQVGSGLTKQWSIFSDKTAGEPVAGLITHIGPGIPISLVCPNAPSEMRPLLKSGTRLIRLQQIEDLLVRTELPTVPCACPEP